MSSQEFSFTWSNHHRSVVGVFGRYLAEETLVDCTIAAEGECLKAHKLVLAACSTYFELLFSQEIYKEKLVVLEGVKFKVLKSLISFMYEGRVTIPKHRLQDYVKVAELLQIKGLPRGLVINSQREATEMSVECRKIAAASQLSQELTRCSAIVLESCSLQCISSIDRKQPSDETFFTCIQTDSSEENVYLQPQYIQESDPTKEIAVFPADKEPSVELKEEVDVDDTPIWDSEDENTSRVTDVSLATAGEVVQRELPPVLGTISGSSFVSSSHILEKDSEASFPKFTSVTATIPSSMNTGCSSTLLSNVPKEQTGQVMEHSSSCELTELSEQIICVKKEPLVKTEVIPLVISLERESRVEKMHEVWVEELQYCEDQELISEMDSADTCNEQTTIQDVDATVAPDNYQSAVWPNDIFKAIDSAYVEAQRARKEVHSLEVKEEREKDEECFAGECSEVDVNDSTVDKVMESGLRVVEIHNDYAIKEKRAMEGQEMETVESALEGDVAVEKSEVEEIDSSPLSERISKKLGRQSHRCLICAGVFISASELRLHVRNMHKKKASKSCKECAATFTYRSQLIRHMRKHSNERPLKCDVCSVSFSQQCYLNRDKRTYTGERPFLCNLCKRSHVSKKHPLKHMLAHTGERPFPCNVCKKSFTLKNSLTVHMRVHTGERPFQCNVCEKSFIQRIHLVNHIRTHTGERPFPCSVCKMSFAQKCSLIQHMRVHTGERPFQCNVCKKSFIQRNDLANHIRTHTGERPFLCSVCKKSFTQKRSLTQHIRRHT